MNISVKALSSPGRPEKYPPPLMRFLRSNAASKSRGKSRSSPMFIRNKKNNNIIEPQQEPTSPKVTCIGQVRSKARTARSKPGSKRFCSCISLKRSKKTKKTKKSKSVCFCSFCPSLGKKLRPRWLNVNLKKWVLFFSCKCCRKTEIREDLVKVESDEDRGTEKEKEVETDEDIVTECPPKNALLLTRCRSAPYQSSSLTSRFCSEENKGMAYQELEKVDKEDKEEKNVHVSEMEGLNEIKEKLVDLKVIGDLISRKSEEIARIKAQPMMLLRCKSEPARTGERLNPNLVVN